MNRTVLMSRVQASRLLTEPEKMYWIQHLPRMSDEQLEKLDSILAEGEQLAWTAKIPNFNAIQSKQTLVS